MHLHISVLMAIVRPCLNWLPLAPRGHLAHLGISLNFYTKPYTMQR